ncbi:MAG: DNA methyltransferase [Labilithrix sp.]
MRHRFHALCPYFAMFPESFAETWIDALTRKNDLVLDPFCGRGTLPFQALLMGRRAIGVDVNEVAYCVSRAKTNAPTLGAVRRRISELEETFDPEVYEVARRRMPEFFRVAFTAGTMRQILFLREKLNWKRSRVDCMLGALTLGSLHGESERSPSFLSNQMPHTISTKPAYSVRFWRKHGFKAPRRDVFDLLRSQAAFRYASSPPDGSASILHMDMRDLPRVGLEEKVRCVITSPPYFDVTSYQEDQWLRLWFLGGAPKPEKTRGEERTSDQDRYWRLIADMWRSLGLVLRRRSDVVVRIGAVSYAPEKLTRQLQGAALACGRRVELVSHAVSEIKRRQTDSFRPGARGCRVEVDCHFAMA